MIEEVRVRPLALPTLLIGIGLGAMVEAITLHQILRWYHLVTMVAPTLAGVVMLFLAARRDDVVWSGRIFAGSLLAGAGAFNLVEGLVAHVLFGVHHVRPQHALAWDLGFVTIGGIGLLLAGFLVGRSEISGDRMSPATRHALGL
jgi:uncharacterized membrane protein